jgi:hypothetical protein
MSAFTDEQQKILNGNRRARLLGGTHCVGRRRNDHVHLEPDELRGEAGQPFGSAIRVPRFDDGVLSVDVSVVAQTRTKRLQVGGIRRRGDQREITDPDDSRLLPLGGERRGDETARQRPNERPPVHHSMT